MKIFKKYSRNILKIKHPYRGRGPVFPVFLCMFLVSLLFWLLLLSFLFSEFPVVLLLNTFPVCCSFVVRDFLSSVPSDSKSSSLASSKLHCINATVKSDLFVCEGEETDLSVFLDLERKTAITGSYLFMKYKQLFCKDYIRLYFTN